MMEASPAREKLTSLLMERWLENNLLELLLRGYSSRDPA